MIADSHRSFATEKVGVIVTRQAPFSILLAELAKSQGLVVERDETTGVWRIVKPDTK